MDPYTSGCARSGAVLRIDCRTREVTYVPWPRAQVRLLVAHSGVRRSLTEGAFAVRRRECDQALAAARDAGVAPAHATALRDLGEEHLRDLSAALDPVLFRRVRHVVRENARVDAVFAALAAADPVAIGALLREGMRSLRDDFEVSTPELDALCDLADSLPGVYGSRLTGAGFGGCTLHLVAPDAAEAVARAIEAGFEARFGRRPSVLAVEPAAGAQVVD
jgi:galactokinase